MLNEGERERIRRAYYLQKKSIHLIAQEEGYSCSTVERAITDAPRSAYRPSRPRPAPRFGPYHARIIALLEQNKHLPPKQLYTAHKIFEILQEEGYQGSEACFRQHLSERKQANQAPEVFLSLEFEPGQNARWRKPVSPCPRGCWAVDTNAVNFRIT